MKKGKIKCPYCQKKTDDYRFVLESSKKTIKGQVIVAQIKKAYCNLCDHEIEDKSILKKNEIKFADAFRRQNGLLTSRQINQIWEQLPFKQIQIKTKINNIRLKLILNGEIQTDFENTRLKNLYEKLVLKKI